MKISEKVNLIATILGPIIISGMMLWAGWSFNAKLSLGFAAQDKYNATAYAPVAALAETNRQLENVTEKVDKLSDDVSNIKGRLSRQSSDKHNN